MISIKDFDILVKDVMRMYDIDMLNYKYEKEHNEDTSGTIKHFNGLLFSINKAYEILLNGLEGNDFNE